MKLDQARALVATLSAAIARAEAAGADEVDLQVALQAEDDAARDELQAAIDAAKATGRQAP